MAVIHFNADPMTSEAQVLGTNSASVLNSSLFAPSTGYGRGQAAQMAFLSLENCNIRYHIASVTATTNCGHLFVSGDYLVLDGYSQMKNFNFISAGTTSPSSVLHVTYFIS